MTHDEAIRTLAVERYLLDEMSELERHEFETHYFECETCAADLRTGIRMADAADTAAATVDDPVPAASPQPFPARTTRKPLSTYVPLAAAALLAVTAGYQTFVTVPALRAKMAPQVVAPLILTPATRGEAPVLTRTGSAMVLSLDVSLVPASGELVYDVRRDAGDRVTTGRTAAPLPGTPLLLLLAEPPAAGPYVVTLREADGPDARESTYRFTVR